MNLLQTVKYPDGSFKAPTIYDPETTCTNPSGCAGDPTKGANWGDRLPFAGNIIPANRINKVAQNYINRFYPVAAVGTNNAVSNYTANYGVGGQNFETVVRLDHQVSDKQHVMTRYTHWGNTNLPQDPLGTGICQDRCSETFATHNWVLDDTYTFNSTTILDLRLSYLRFAYTRAAKDITYQPSDIGQDLGGATVEYPGPLVVSIQAGPNSGGNTGFDISNTFGSGGADSTIGNYSDNDRIAGNLTKIVGKHTFKFGGEYLRATFNYFQTNNSAGQGSVDATYTKNNSGNGNLGNSYSGAGLATFLLGYTNAIGYNNVASTTDEMLYPALYATDDWRVTPKLTLHLGMRWENGLPWTDRRNNISFFDPTATNPVLLANSTTLIAQGTTASGTLGTSSYIPSSQMTS